MGKKDKDRKRQAKQQKWEKENEFIQKVRKQGGRMKTALRAQGCVLPFYDLIDPSEDEFKKLIAWAKSQFPTLHEVYEVGPEEESGPKKWKQFGLPDDWKQIKFACDDELAQSYTAEDDDAGLRGGVTAFRDGTGALRTIIEVVKNPKCPFEHKEHRYLFKIPVLLHEIGHVKDYEGIINVNPDSGAIDLIEAEVFANLFALNECYRRAYYMSGTMFFDSLANYRTATDYRGDVVRRVFERFQKPAHRPWTEYKL